MLALPTLWHKNGVHYGSFAKEAGLKGRDYRRGPQAERHYWMDGRRLAGLAWQGLSRRRLGPSGNIAFWAARAGAQEEA